jgi:hypothetical protein
MRSQKRTISANKRIPLLAFGLTASIGFGVAGAVGADAGSDYVDARVPTIVDQTTVSVEEDAKRTVLTESAPSDNGRGENLILVVQGTYSSAGAATLHLAKSGGHTQSFYLASSDSFEVKGYYINDAPSLLEIDCSVGAPTEHVLCDSIIADEYRNSTELDASKMLVKQQVSLKYFLTSEELIAPELCRTELDSMCSSPAMDALINRGLTFDEPWLLVTAFRTKQGAEEFIDFATATGMAEADELMIVRVHNVDSGFIGLGQEAHPDGSGPLLEPLPHQDKDQTE